MSSYDSPEKIDIKHREDFDEKNDLEVNSDQVAREAALRKAILWKLDTR